MKEASEPSLERLEQQLAQRLILLYQSLLGRELQQVSCKLADQTVTILAEDSITQVERFLAQSARQDLAQQVRKSLLKALEPHLQTLIEEIVGVPVVDVISDAGFDSSRMSIVSVLAATPEPVRLTLQQVKSLQKPENLPSRDGDG